MLTVGWYYGYNPDQKPIKGTVMPVCKLLKMVDTPIGKRCIIKVIGDIANREIYSYELSPMVLIKNADIANFASGFAVSPDQRAGWERHAK